MALLRRRCWYGGYDTDRFYGRGSNSVRGKNFFSSPKRPAGTGILSREVKVIIHLIFLPTLRMSGAVHLPSLDAFMARTGKPLDLLV